MVLASDMYIGYQLLMDLLELGTFTLKTDTKENASHLCYFDPAN